ncbi:MAG: antibiotic biosynthesis monooxygenase family protein [Micropruina sp.]
MLAISRFQVVPERTDDFVARAQVAVDFMSARDGCQGVDFLRNLDDPDLWTITSRWVNVGSYRRAFNGFEAKMILVSLLSEAIDEPSAYDLPEAVGENLPRSR